MMYMLTAHRKKFTFFPVKPDAIDFRDIAHSLAKLPRYNGHGPIDLHYSVAEHSVLMANHAYFTFEGEIKHAAAFALAVLLHDAHEAYTGDLTIAAKGAAGHNYKLLCDATQFEINAKFNVFSMASSFADEIKELDRRILLNERPAIYPGSEPWEWESEYDPLPIDRIYGWSPTMARDMMIGHFMILANRMNHPDSKTQLERL